ncbi:adenine-specific methyltransferase [Mycobacterium phage KanikaMF1]|nr:adenine-specific methyltransferase [Mycobacterium phage KanikaMF1]WLG15509.1 DNA methyltransferase [Mycobacterium phage MTBP1]
MMDGPSPATPEAAQWQGWGTALKPAFEPIVVARKPLAGTVAANVLEHGTGALNIDACRVGDEVRVNPPGSTNPRVAMGDGWRADAEARIAEGRWPTNVVLDEAQAAELDAQTGDLKSGLMRAGTKRAARDGAVYGRLDEDETPRDTYADSGGASRFFPVFRYEAKAPGAERPSVVTTKLRLRADLTPEQVDHVVARLREAGVEID